MGGPPGAGSPGRNPRRGGGGSRAGAGLIVAHHPVMNVRWHEQEMQTLRDDTRLGGF